MISSVESGSACVKLSETYKATYVSGWLKPPPERHARALVVVDLLWALTETARSALVLSLDSGMAKKPLPEGLRLRRLKVQVIKQDLP